MRSCTLVSGTGNGGSGIVQPVIEVVYMKNLLAAARAFAIMNLLFVPAIGIVVMVALLGGGTYWFAFFGLPAFTINAIAVFSKPSRRFIWKFLNTGELFAR